MTIDEELKVEHFKHLCEQTRHYNDKLTEAFSFYVTTLSAIVGGSIWLASNISPIDRSKIHILASLADTICFLLTIITLVRVTGNLVAWFNIRASQHDIFKEVPAPHRFWSTWLEVGLAVAVVAACALFFWQNPFIVLVGK